MMKFLQQKRYYLANIQNPNAKYVIHNAIYIGSYHDHVGNKMSHKFLHLVSKDDLIEFVGSWVHIAQNITTTTINGVCVMETHIYDTILSQYEIVNIY